MIKRDYYFGDYTSKYYAKVSESNFLKDIKDNKHLDLIIFKDQDIDTINQVNDLQGWGYLAIMTLSFGSVLSFHRIPLLKNINNQWGKLVSKTGLFIIPPYVKQLIFKLLFYQFIESQKSIIKWQQYITYFEQYKTYKQTGDLRYLKENIKIE